MSFLFLMPHSFFSHRTIISYYYLHIVTDISRTCLALFYHLHYVPASSLVFAAYRHAYTTYI